MKIGVIGLGSIGMRHARNLIAAGHDVSGYDPNNVLASAFENLGATFVSSEDIYKRNEAIIVASPSHHHLHDALAAAGNSKHIFIEKPLAHTLNGLDKLQEIAKQKSLTVAIGMNMRFNPAIQRLKEYITTEKLGKILWANYWHSSYLPDWRPHANYKEGYAANPETGGVLFDVIHGFDVLYYLLGSYDVNACVAGSSGVLDIPSDDYADVICVNGRSANLSLHMDFMSKPKTHTLSIAGTKGVVRIDITNREFEFTDPSGHVIENQNYSDRGVNDDYAAELNDFINAINGQNLTGCTLIDGCNVLKSVITARSLAGLPHADC